MINWRELQKHAINKFPPMSDEEFNELKESLSNGYDDTFPIIVYKGEADSFEGIIDGVNRHKACLEVGVIPIIKHFYGSYEDAMKLVLRTNTRRNLSAGQKAAVVLDMSAMVSALVDEAAERKESTQFGGGGAASSPTGKTAKKLADIAGVGKDTIKYANKVKQHDPGLYEAVKQGNISAKAAYGMVQEKIASQDSELQKQRTAKSLLKKAIQEAIDADKDDLYTKALEAIANDQAQQFKLKITLL